jgi:hypothetical protein
VLPKGTHLSGRIAVGIYFDNSRFPSVDESTGTYTWTRNRPGRGEPVVVEHIKEDDTVTIGYGGEDIGIPLRQVRWLAEVLLQVTDFYREEFVSDARDDYTRSDKIGERR